jgi:hypothetical protein
MNPGTIMRTLLLRFSILFAFAFCMNARAGYTHYFVWHQKPDDAALKACVGEMRRIIEARTNILAGPDGTNAIEIDSSHVDLNGIGDDAHEPFVFPGALGFDFCKTDGKPYDEVVTACLLVARDHFPSSILSIDSDGSWSDGDWNGGIELYRSVLGRTPRNPMSPLWRVVGWRSSMIWYYMPIVLLVCLGLYWVRKRFRRW